MNLRTVRVAIGFFIFGLVISGVTAFPLVLELRLLCGWLGIPEGARPEALSGLGHWLAWVRQGLEETSRSYPFLAYGTDWLAFAHFAIAVFFVGAWKDPVRNAFIIDAGIVCCLGVIPLALICGPLRGIPFYWRMIDCSFGVIGVLPLLYARRCIIKEQP